MELRLYPNLILEALKNVRYPGTGTDIVTAGMVEDDIRIDGMKVSFSIVFDKPTDPFSKSVIRAAETAINTYISPDVEIKGNIAMKSRTQLPPKPENPLPGVKNIIGVSSGKGGGIARAARLQSGSARCRHFRPLGAQNVRCGRRAARYDPR